MTEEQSWLTYGEPPHAVEYLNLMGARVDEQNEQAPDAEPVYATAREAIDAWMAAGWTTPDVPDWVTGGYVTKERAAAALRLLADRMDGLQQTIDTVVLERINAEHAILERLYALERRTLPPEQLATLQGPCGPLVLDQITTISVEVPRENEVVGVVPLDAEATKPKVPGKAKA